MRLRLRVVSTSATMKMASGGSRSMASNTPLKSSDSRTPRGCTVTPSDRAASASRCPLYPQKRTLELNRVMSALCQKRTFCAATADALFDHLIGAGEQGFGHLHAEHPGSRQIDHEIE